MKIAIIDSGITPDHIHVGPVAGGISLVPGSDPQDIVDRLGHGTAVAGAIRERAPDAELYAVKIFDRRLASTIDAVLSAVAWCREQQMDIVNMSLGTSNQAHREAFVQALDMNGIVVSVADSLPGSLPGVIAVAADAGCLRGEYRYLDGVFYTSPYPRPIPGIPLSANLQGVSFSVANMTGHIASIFRTSGRESLWTDLLANSKGNG